ncbi:hypothetical protein ACE6H2_013610 [Prunus campanulata]
MAHHSRYFIRPKRDEVENIWAAKQGIPTSQPPEPPKKPSSYRLEETNTKSKAHHLSSPQSSPKIFDTFNSKPAIVPHFLPKTTNTKIRDPIDGPDSISPSGRCPINPFLIFAPKPSFQFCACITAIIISIRLIHN